MIKKLALLFLLLCLSIPCHAGPRKSRWKEKQSWDSYFRSAKVKGCFLLYDLQKDKYSYYSLRRINTGFLPGSTFKIFNSLVALETSAIRDEREVLKWDGVERIVPAWNQDQSMRDALKNSTVWFYQEMARRVGKNRMQRYVNAAGYGNRNIGGGIDHFWLDGDLRITAKEQIDMLVKLNANRLPFSARTTSLVKDILIYEKTENYTLRAKTGWVGFGAKSSQQVGWWVGYVERGAEVYFFAMNIDIKKDEDAAARVKITKDILREMNIT